MTVVWVLWSDRLEVVNSSFSKVGVTLSEGRNLSLDGS